MVFSSIVQRDDNSVRRRGWEPIHGEIEDVLLAIWVIPENIAVIFGIGIGIDRIDGQVRGVYTARIGIENLEYRDGCQRCTHRSATA